MRACAIARVVVSVAVAATAAVTAASGAGAAPTTTTTPAQRIRLITGEVISVRDVGGVRQVSIDPRTHDAAGNLMTLRQGKAVYVVPTAAMRYLGTVLDRGLFDVAAAKPDSRTPVSIAIRSGSAPAIPGVTVTSRSSTDWHGYLTPSGAREFGAALADQARQDALAHRVSRTLFGGVTGIAPAVAVARPVQPAFPQQTLTINVHDAAGTPVDYADVALANVDDVRKFANFIPAVDGLAKVSVPTGTYSAFVTVDEYAEDGTDVLRLLPVEQIQVGAKGGTVDVDVDDARSRPAVHTPRPASLDQLALEWDRVDSNGVSVSNSYLFFGNDDVLVAPSARATKGQVDWVTTWRLHGAPAGGVPYTYDLSFLDTGRVPADQNRTVTESGLARLDSNYYADTSQPDNQFGRVPVYPFQSFFFLFFEPLSAPQSRTEYIAAPPSAQWSADYEITPSYDSESSGSVYDSLQKYRPGTRQRVDWLRGPIAPGVSTPFGGEDQLYCGYCRTAGSMALEFNPMSDTEPGHAGYFYLPDEDTVAARFRLYRDGKLVDDQTNATGDDVDVPRTKATYRALSEADRGVAGFPTSTTSTLDLTFVSSPTSGAKAPSNWVCPVDGSCTVLPLLEAKVPLPTDLGSTMRLGSVPTTFTVRHVAGAADPAISKVRFAQTFDGGKTWTDLPVTAKGGHQYGVTLHNPANRTSTPVGIRISAVDAAGGKLTETVQAAYVTAQS